MGINKERILRSRQADLVAYFERNGYKIKRDGNKGHWRVPGYGGLIVKDNMFYQFSTDLRGNSLDCLIKVLGYDFIKAVLELSGMKPSEKTKVPECKELVLPARAGNMRRVFAYMCNTRGIQQGLVEQLVKGRMLYQDHKGNCVFVWKDDGEPVGAEIVGTLDKVRFKGVAKASMYGRGFEVKRGVPDKAYFFESAIDLLSFMSLKEGCPELDNAIFVSMSGLKEAVIECYLGKFSVKAFLCVDNDKHGDAFASLFTGRTEVIKPKNKDWNIDLVESARDDYSCENY